MPQYVHAEWENPIYRNSISKGIILKIKSFVIVQIQVNTFIDWNQNENSQFYEPQPKYCLHNIRSELIPVKPFIGFNSESQVLADINIILGSG